MSTMNQKNYELIEKSNIKTGVVVNQTKIDSRSVINNSILWINSKTKGLSKSRNIAIQNSKAEICVFGDDDLEYIENYEKIIEREFEDLKIDIVCFQVEGIEKKFKNYKPEPKKIGFMDALQVSSVEIAFRRSPIITKNLKFDELFGAGSTFSMGEENIFLYDALRANLKIKYVPVKIANLHMSESSWFKGFNEEYLINRGAIFRRMSKRYYILLIIQFALRKRKLFQDLNFFEIIFKMLSGSNKYNKMSRNN